MAIQAPREASRNEAVDCMHIIDANYAQRRRTEAAHRQLLATMVESIQLYGESTWADYIPAYLVDKNMSAVQRKMNLRIISG